MKFRTLTFAGLASLLLAGHAFSFGTVTIMGQNVEHERITRHALGCGQPPVVDTPPPSQCFRPYSLDQMAGKRGSFGAVGAPDHPANGQMTASEAHCDNADYLAPQNNGGRTYPRSEDDARRMLIACRESMRAHLQEAVNDAPAMLLANGRVNDSQIPTMKSCDFAYAFGKGRAKCNVLEDFGRVLHATQDFYSHSNWVDRPDANLPSSRSNPPGLGAEAPAPWLDLERGKPDRSGCVSRRPYHRLFQESCRGVGSKRLSWSRFQHLYLNKDKGQIDDPRTGQMAFGPTGTPRGVVNVNFQRAVQAAIADSRLQWATLQQMIIARYGAQRGGTMICALVMDNPARECR